MARFVVILSVIFLLWLPVSFAEKLIFSGSVITEQNKVLPEGTFKFFYEESSNKVFAETPTVNMIVENGDCKSNGVFKICIRSANFSDRNLTTYQTFYKIDLDIYKLTGTLTTASTALSNTLLKSESTDITVTITNPTDLDVTNINYDEDLSSFIIKEIKGCSLNNEHMVWQGSLGPNYAKTCTATIIAYKSGLYNLAGTLGYFNGFETEKNSTGSSVTITVLPFQLAINQTYDKNVEILQPFYLNTSMQNINPTEKMQVYLNMVIPWNLQILKYTPGLSRDVNGVSSTFILEPFAYFNYSLYLKPSSEANNKVKEKFDYNLKETKDSLDNEIIVSSIEPKPVVYFTSENNLSLGQKFVVVVKLTNPSNIYKFNDIQSALNVPYNNILQQHLEKLRPNESSTVISNEFFVPREIDASDINLSLSIKYTLNDAEKSMNKSIKININRFTQTAPVNANATTKTNVESHEVKNLNETQTRPDNTKKAQVMEEIKSLKSNIFDKKVLIFFGALLIAVFLPVIIYNIRKRKKQNEQQNISSNEPQEQDASSNEQPPDEPKDF